MTKICGLRELLKHELENNVMKRSMEITPQHGKNNDMELSHSFDDREDAVDCFKRACKRLLNPPVWHELAGALSGEFKLVTTDGAELKRLAKEGDLFRIDLPGPGPKAGGGYDWVRVDFIEERYNEVGEEEFFAMRVSPAPGTENPQGPAAHFFKEGASSTFEIHRIGDTVTAMYHGRNEIPNNDTESTFDNIRNTVVAASAVVGLSEAQWSLLIKALLEPEIGG